MLERALTSDGWCAFAVGILFLAFYAATISPPTQYNEHARLAWALLHGHTWVDVPSYMEHVVVGGRSYILHPPLSAILMLPAAAIWGAAANQTAVSVVLGAVSIALWWRLMGRLGLGIPAKIWLSAFMGVGTTLWYEATLGSSWDFALLASVPFTLAALGEVFGEARPWAVGVLAALARARALRPGDGVADVCADAGGARKAAARARVDAARFRRRRAGLCRLQ